VRFSIVTPSFGQLDWLKLATRSVADQAVEFEHILQDAGTGPDLDRWVRECTSAQLHVEQDSGMYDALNRGFPRATGEIWAWLNCDEQYLPGALTAVEAYFIANPEIDVLLADNLIVDESGQYLAHRFSLVPTISQLWVRFPVASCALFFRARVWRPFDPQWKSAADWWWFRDLLLRGAKLGVLRRFVAAFTETQANLGLALVTADEQGRILDARPWWARVGKPVLIAQHRWRMWRSGAFSVAPFRYALYPPESATSGADCVPTSSSAVARREFSVLHPSARWRRSHGAGSSAS
jgi:glycosyltransferase involved in cell wall biosynthesis